MSRWRLLDRTTPSGKLLYECTVCGRVTPTPDKTCLRAGCGFASEEERAAAEQRAAEHLAATLASNSEKAPPQSPPHPR